MKSFLQAKTLNKRVTHASRLSTTKEASVAQHEKLDLRDLNEKGESKRGRLRKETIKEIHEVKIIGKEATTGFCR